uniref:Iron hydrogenase small subunit domain-containing protein n=1 Tax=Timema monikensis TaxID=170555 RepID=A0A7R9E5A3_9NEOP|nr:unnamed protein product [Timema monikensis]
MSGRARIPVQECIKPVKIEKTETGTGARIKIQDDGSYVQLREGREHKLQKVEISLSDCLACSGCITSAESVLITQQSHEEVIKVFQENLRLKQATSPLDELGDMLLLVVKGYFKKLGADLVLDMNIADDLSLLENQREFIERYRAAQEREGKHLPMLASSCPGWVCYAEKTHGAAVLPHISSAKSPQQVMGSLVKYYLAEQRGFSPERVYHVTLMPCYDKKLEASREDFFNSQLGARDVDCVITAIELEQLLRQEGVDLSFVDSAPLDYPWGPAGDKQLFGHRGSGSGGYADHIFTFAAKELFGDSVDQLQYKSLRNPDFREVSLERDGKPVLKFAIANGFRNIQNLVQKMKQVVFVTGCLNGGAQVRPLDGVHSRELTTRLEAAYSSLPQRAPEDNPTLERLYSRWLAGPHSDKSRAMLHTTYHAVEKMNTAITIKW